MYNQSWAPLPKEIGNRAGKLLQEDNGERGRNIAVLTRQGVPWIYVTIFSQNPHYGYFYIWWFSFNEYIPVLKIR